MDWFDEVDWRSEMELRGFEDLRGSEMDLREEPGEESRGLERI